MAETISTLKGKIKIQEGIIEVAKSEISSLNSELFKLEWTRMEWSELEEWLKKNRPENKYCYNPIVYKGGHYSYCFLTEKGELQIGPYYRYDHFPRGEYVYVSSEFKSWMQN